MMILNLTQHKSTTEQRAAGVRDLDEQDRRLVGVHLTFDEVPSASRLEACAAKLAVIAFDRVPQGTRVMIGGAPYLMAPLERALSRYGLRPVYAFSRRESIERVESSGNVVKVTVFRHLGFVEPRPPGILARRTRKL